METQILKNKNEDIVLNYDDKSGGMLAIGEQVGSYIVESKLNTDSGEAELYICNKGNIKYVLKYYYECEPKYEILDKLKSYNNPDIVSLYEYGEYKSHFYTILEYAEGGSLDSKLKDGTYKYLPVSEDIALQITKEVINAFKQIHEAGIIHRDIKPGNLFYKNKDGSDILVGDFGISSYFDIEEGMSKHLTQTSSGTVGYSAPESYSGIIGPELDYYSFGVTLWELLTAKEPFVNSEDKVMYPGQIMHDTIQGKMVDNLLNRSPELSLKMRTLIRGLMTNRHDKRWNYDLVKSFLDGEDVPVYQDSYQLPSFQIGDVVCTNYKEIAQELLKNPELGKEIIYGNKLTRYLGKVDLKFANTLADKIDEYSAKNKLDAGLIFVVYSLCPNLGFRITDDISISNLSDVKNVLKTNSTEMYEYLKNDDLGFYTYMEVVIGCKDISDKIQEIVANTENSLLVVPKVMIALDNNTITPFNDGEHNNIKLSNINQLKNLDDVLKNRILLWINTNDSMFCAWLENVSGRKLSIWQNSCSDENFKRRIDEYGEYNYFLAFLNKCYIPVYHKFESNGEWGLQDIQNNVVMDTAWQNIKEDSIENIFIVEKNDLWGIVGIDGKEYLPLEYKKIEVFDELNGIYNVLDNNDNYSCININKNCLLKGKINNYSKVGNKFYFQVLNDNCLYSYQNGKFNKIKQFKILYPAKTGNDYILWGKESNNCSFYDIYGNKTPNSTKSYEIDEVLEDRDKQTYFIVRNNSGLYGIVDGNGKEILSMDYSEIINLESRIYLKKDGKIGCYDIDDKKIINPIKYDHIIYYDNISALEKENSVEIYKKENGKFNSYGFIEYDKNNEFYKIYDKNKNCLSNFKYSRFLKELDDYFSYENMIDIISDGGFRYFNLCDFSFTNKEELYESDWEDIKSVYSKDEIVDLAKAFKSNGNILNLNLLASCLEQNTRKNDDYNGVKKEIYSLLRKNKTEGLKFNFDYYMACLAKVYAGLENYQYALDYYQLAVSLNNEECWYCWRGYDVAYKLSKYKEALPLIDRALELEPQDPWLLDRKGDCLRAMGKLEDAISFYTMAIEIEEKKAFFNDRGNAYNELSNQGAPNLKQKAEADWEYAKTLSD